MYRISILLTILVLFGLSSYSNIDQIIEPSQDSITTITTEINNRLKLSDELRNSDIKQAMIVAKEALGLAEQINNQLLVAESNLAVGKCYEYLGGYLEAIDHLTHALDIFVKLDNKIKLAQTYKRIGDVYYYSNKYKVAIGFYNHVYTCGQEVKDTLLTIEALIGRGSVYGNTNKMDSALVAFKESYSLAKSIGDKATEDRKSVV